MKNYQFSKPTNKCNFITPDVFFHPPINNSSISGKKYENMYIRKFNSIPAKGHVGLLGVGSEANYTDNLFDNWKFH